MTSGFPSLAKIKKYATWDACVIVNAVFSGVDENSKMEKAREMFPFNEENVDKFQPNIGWYHFPNEDPK